MEDRGVPSEGTEPVVLESCSREAAERSVDAAARLAAGGTCDRLFYGPYPF